MDVMMPEMSGIEACSEIKQIDELSETMIIFLSARSEDYTQISAYDAGADDYISKPIKPKILLKKKIPWRILLCFHFVLVDWE